MRFHPSVMFQRVKICQFFKIHTVAFVTIRTNTFTINFILYQMRKAHSLPPPPVLLTYFTIIFTEEIKKEKETRHY